MTLEEKAYLLVKNALVGPVSGFQAKLCAGILAPLIAEFVTQEISNVAHLAGQPIIRLQ